LNPGSLMKLLPLRPRRSWLSNGLKRIRSTQLSPIISLVVLLKITAKSLFCLNGKTSRARSILPPYCSAPLRLWEARGEKHPCIMLKSSRPGGLRILNGCILPGR